MQTLDHRLTDEWITKRRRLRELQDGSPEAAFLLRQIEELGHRRDEARAEVERRVLAALRGKPRERGPGGPSLLNPAQEAALVALGVQVPEARLAPSQALRNSLAVRAIVAEAEAACRAELATARDEAAGAAEEWRAAVGASDRKRLAAAQAAEKGTRTRAAELAVQAQALAERLEAAELDVEVERALQEFTEGTEVERSAALPLLAEWVAARDQAERLRLAVLKISEASGMRLAQLPERIQRRLGLVAADLLRASTTAADVEERRRQLR